MKRLLLVVLLLAGCSAQASDGLVVTLKTSAKQVESFEPVTITASVSLSGEALLEPDEIDFEMINGDGFSIGTVTPTTNGDGTFEIETSFDAAGTYTIISHVTHAEFHEMPEVKVVLK